MAKPEVSIIVVNWNSADVLVDCLNSIYKNVKNSFELIIVDNNSSDDSVNLIKKCYPQVILLEQKENLGFSKANNLGFNKSKGDFILILNPDTILLENSINKMRDFLLIHPDVGIVGPKIFEKSGDISIVAKRKLPSILGDLKKILLLEKILHLIRLFIKKTSPKLLEEFYSYYNKSEECKCLQGSCMMLKREVYDFLGGFDEAVPMYLDDIDFCFRSLKEGFINYYLAEAEIMHIGQHSTKKALNYKIYDVLALQGHLFFYRKNFGLSAYLLFKLVILISIPYLICIDIFSFPYFVIRSKIPEFTKIFHKHAKYLCIVLFDQTDCL